MKHDQNLDLQATPDQEELKRLLSRAGSATVVYTDGPLPLPRSEVDAARKALLARARECGSPAPDIAALESALTQEDGTPSPSSRYIVIRDGQIEANLTFAGTKFGPERVYFGPVVALVPLLRHLARSVRYLVVEANREGAQVRLGRADRHAPQQVDEVEGRTDSLTKVQAGGWSHARYQRAAEEVWKHNQSEVAEVVSKLVEQQHPEFVLLAGDVRARQTLKNALDDATLALLHEHEVHTRAEGADAEGLSEAIIAIVESHVRNELARATDRARSGDGDSGAQGLTSVVEALQQARVEALVIDARLIDADEVLLALDSQPWVAEVGTEASAGFDAQVIDELPAAEALARAAVLTGARVLIREEQFGAADSARSNEQPDAPIAALRWPNGK